MSIQDIIANLKQLEEDIQQGAQEGAEAAAKRVLEEAQDNVPVVTGNLRDSGRVVEENGNASVSFDADYAVNVHEDVNSEGYKFLERAALDVNIEGEIFNHLQKRIKGA